MNSTVMLAGDDEMNVILAEMGGGTAAAGSTSSANKPKPTPIITHEKVDFRLADDPRTEPWPPQFCLGKSFQEGFCAGWNQSNPKVNDKCQDCQTSRVFHRLGVKEYTKKNKKKMNSQLLSWLFCHTRNIRCVASENIAPCKAIMEESLQQLFQLLIDNNKGAKQVLTSTDYAAIHEKAVALRTIILESPTTFSSATKKSTTIDDWRLQVLLHADRLYYRIYYAWLTTTATATTMKIPHPPTYFASPGMSWKVSTDEAHEFCHALTPSVFDLLVKTMGLFEDDSSILNPLHILWQHRFYEMIRHFWKRSTPQTINVKCVESRPDHLQPEFAIHETLSPCPLLAEWRDGARDFPASLYAYATPSPLALQTIFRHIFDDDDDDHTACRRLVEVGAGTGYWAAVLQQYLQQNNSSQNQTVQPFDLHPPGTFSDNDYHSEVPAFTTVQQSDATAVVTNNNDDLLLCYPPPGTDMAVSALRAFNGDCIVHIGEWAGLTGNEAFEDLLMASFTCQANLALPLWGTDAAYLTIWKRCIHHNNRDTPATTLTIATGGCLGCNGQRRATKRCRLARMIQYCSLECFTSHKETRKSLLLLHMIDLHPNDKDLGWEDPQHFTPVQPITHERTTKNGQQEKAGDSDNAHQKKRRKRKHKKKPNKYLPT